MKKLEDTFAVILAGGIGSRFWPVSRETRPKQFVDILGTGRTLIQDAYNRFINLVPQENIFIITNQSYVDLVKEQLPLVTDNQILGEPSGKNTAACAAYAANKIFEISENGVLIIAPSDHLIQDTEEFNRQIQKAHSYAKENDALVTLGIKPHRPDTGYGYIQYESEEILEGINKVKTFTEKPPLELAEKFLESGDFLWNSGMFVWSVSSILIALNEHLPELNLSFSEAKGVYNTTLEKQHIDRIYTNIASISVDNGILEKAENVYVLPSAFGWSDLGTWKSVHENLQNDELNTTLNVQLHAVDASNNLVVSEKEKLVVIKGLDGYFIVDTDDALLICKKDQEQEVKKLVGDIRKRYNGKYN